MLTRRGDVRHVVVREFLKSPVVLTDVLNTPAKIASHGTPNLPRN